MIKYKLLDLPSDNLYGMRKVNGHMLIGNLPVEVKGLLLAIGDEEFNLTSGLLELLTQKLPEGYTVNDLREYKNILLITNAHKRKFDPKQRINVNNSWKYKNIISKLFPPKRTYSKTIRSDKFGNESIADLGRREQHQANESEEDEEMSKEYVHYSDINELVERLMALEASRQMGNNNNNLKEIYSILGELERLGVIEFNK